MQVPPVPTPRPHAADWHVVSAAARQRRELLESLAPVQRTGPPGRQIAWHAIGDGPPVVLLHGGHGSWLHWLRNIEALVARHRLHMPDMPGFGASDDAVAPTLDALVDQLQAGIDERLGTRVRFALVGFSFGGLVAATLASRCARVERLALLGPGGHGTPRRPRGTMLNWREVLPRRDAAQLHAVMRHNLLVHMVHDEATLDDAGLQVHTEACLRTRFRSKPISLAGNLAASLDAFGGPLLMTWGEADVTGTPHEAIERLCNGRPGREGVIVPGAGHWVAYEASEAVNRLLGGFLAPSASPAAST